MPLLLYYMSMHLHLKYKMVHDMQRAIIIPHVGPATWIGPAPVTFPEYVFPESPAQELSSPSILPLRW